MRVYAAADNERVSVDKACASQWETNGVCGRTAGMSFLVEVHSGTLKFHCVTAGLMLLLKHANL